MLALAAGIEIRERPAGGWNLSVEYTRDQIAILEKLNRADPPNLARLKTMAIPEEWDYTELAYSPFPEQWQAAAAEPKYLVVYLPVQAFAAYEYGRLVRWGALSSGTAAHPTPPGLYHLNWKSPGRHSTVNHEWFMPHYFNFDNWNGLSLHQYAMPGRPSSHSCIRLLEADAKWLAQWGEGWVLSGGQLVRHGTPLWIIGRYRFESLPPWLEAGPAASEGLPSALP